MAHENVNGINRSLASIDGLVGYLVAVVGLVVSLVILVYFSVVVQAENATVYYKVNQDIHAIKAIGPNNNSFRTIVK